MDNEAWTIKQRLKKQRRKRRLRLLRLLLIIGLLAYGSVKGWEYIHSPDFAFGRVKL